MSPFHWTSRESVEMRAGPSRRQTLEPRGTVVGCSTPPTRSPRKVATFVAATYLSFSPSLPSAGGAIGRPGSGAGSRDGARASTVWMLGFQSSACHTPFAYSSPV
jgi:hypothetical protein